ncbi:hypothetical protein DRP04_04860 [Archaeoglobales archaeon]|nr:MAG: hypothetical protein DRP04_04860 [Archaeoglobales archaeon]
MLQAFDHPSSSGIAVRRIRTKKLGVDVYWYFRRKSIGLDLLKEINGKTWSEAAKIVGTPIPCLFILLSHAKKAGLIKEVRIR